MSQIFKMNMFLRKSAPFATVLRNFSAKTKNLVETTINEQSGVATVILQRPPVNSLNLELLTELNTNLTDLEKSKCRGIILKSSSDTVFCAGLDIFEMYKPDADRMKQFWTALQNVWINLYGHSAPTVACINGHAPAGGCLLALSCEYRVMVDKNTIGLNETQLGIVAPPWFIKSMKNVIGQRQTELALTAGRMFNTKEALQVGLVDDVANDSSEAMQKSEEFIGRFKRISSSARAMTKKLIRGKTIKSLVENREADLKLFQQAVMQEKVQIGLEMYLQSLKKKSN